MTRDKTKPATPQPAPAPQSETCSPRSLLLPLNASHDWARLLGAPALSAADEREASEKGGEDE